MNETNSISGESGGRSCAGLLVGLALSLIFFVWAGSGADSRNVLPWAFTGDGWLEPARGLTWMLVASVLLYVLLSRLAYGLFVPEVGAKKFSGRLSASLIFVAAILVRVFIACTWLRLPQSAPDMASSAVVHFSFFHMVCIFGDMLVVGLLLLALRRAPRSPWWAALYAFHPLVLMEISGNGHWLPLLLLPMLVVVLVFSQQHLLVALLTAMVTLGAHYSLGRQPWFNSLPGAFLPESLLILLQLLLQGVVLVVAVRNDWSTVRIVLHMLTVFILFSPVVTPVMALPVLMLLPLGWSRAGWVLSLLLLSGYVAIPTFGITHQWEVPGIVLVLAWVPIAVVEAQELLREFFLSEKTSAASATISLAAMLHA